MITIFNKMATNMSGTDMRNALFSSPKALFFAKVLSYIALQALLMDKVLSDHCWLRYKSAFQNAETFSWKWPGGVHVERHVINQIC